MEPTVSTAVGKSLDLVPARLTQHAEERPDQVVLAFLDEHGSIQHSLTFGELDRQARSIGAHLQQRGLSGEPVALSYPSELEFVAAFCGCLYAGAIAVPTTLPKSHGVDERMAMIVADSGARAVLTSRRYLGAIERRLAEASSAADAIGTDALSDRAAEWAPVEWRGEQLAMLQYTSGSTRSPSGVMIQHRNLAANLECLHQVWRTHRDSVSVSWLPLFHDMGLIAGVLQPLWVGYATFLMAPATFVQSPLRWLRAFSRYGGTIGGGPNFAYEACVEAAQATPPTDLDLSRWELAWNGAEPIRATTLDAFRATFSAHGFRASSLTPGYGLAEATLLVTGSNAVQPALELVVDELELGNDRVRRCPADSARAKRLVSSGRPGPATDLRIVQRDGRVEVGRGEVGEIWVRSDSVGAGYWRKAEDSLATFDGRLLSGDGPFLRTGDLGFQQDGELFVTGRLKDVIVIRGVNWYPHDLEYTVERSHPSLRPDAGAVVGLDHGGRVELVVVQEVRRDGWRTINPATVFDAIRRAVAREHQLALRGIVLLKPFSLPKTSSGKVQRARCRAAVEDGSLPALHEWWAPAAPVALIDFSGEPLTQPGVIERQLVDWLQRECALTDVSWKTPLMELGIDSLKGVELGNALSAAFNHSFPATLMIDHPTIEALASLIRQEVLGVAPVRVVAPPVFAVAAGGSPLRAADVAALGDAELDALLRKSIDEVLGSGGRS